MILTVNDQAHLSGRIIRRIKYLLYKLKEKFDQIIYSRVHITSEGGSPELLNLKVVIGLPGQDLIFTCKEEEPDFLVKSTYLKVKRMLSRHFGKKSP